MTNTSFKKKIVDATKWSTLSQLITKIISPLSTMILARLLLPEVFGVVATITMIISFTELFTDVGFQKYLVQHEFENETEFVKSVNVAFWTNLMISLFLFSLIIVFRNNIAVLVGNPNLGMVIAIASIQLPISSFSSIQFSLFRRKFDFKSLFKLKLIVSLMPLLLTVPLAYLGFSYWSLIITSIFVSLLNAVILTIISEWKPKFYYSFYILKEMFSFSFWSMLEAISIWLTTWIDIFIIGNMFGDYYTGLYKNSTSMIMSIMTIVTASLTPILFVSLSRLQNNKKIFNDIFLMFQKIIAYILFPMAIGIFIYQDFATTIFFGNGWEESENIVGIWAIVTVLRIVMVSLYSEAYRALGRPKLSFFMQSIDLLILVPVLIIASKSGFWTMVYTRAILKLDLIIPALFVMTMYIGINGFSLLKNILKPLIATIIMGLFTYLLRDLYKNYAWNVIVIILSIILYAFVVFILDKTIVNKFLGILRKKKLTFGDKS